MSLLLTVDLQRVLYYAPAPNRRGH